MLFERPEAGYRAVVLQVELKNQANPAQDEFIELARSAQIDVVAAIIAKRDAPQSRSFVGTGKVDEVSHALRGHNADLLLINHEISPSQQRNLEQALACRVITRTELILSIFADRARSHEGQLQVELAQLKHAQTRLVRGWTHLDRQKGGIGLRGAGEKQIELDQRMLGERIKAAEKRLGDVAKRRSQNRRNRRRRGAPTIALVGYTNAGKSTLFNRLTNAGVHAEDQLFVTLDPTMRSVPIAGLNDVVLVDTVGFVSLLPHALVEAFKATLEELVQADLLLHVVDVSDPLHDERVGQVREVLREIGADQVAELVVYNKVDQLAPNAPMPGCAIDAGVVNSVAVSGLTGQGMSHLSRVIGDALGVVAPHQVVIDSADGRTRAWLYRSGAVLAEQLLDDGNLQLTLQADQQMITALQARPRVSLRQPDLMPRISNGN